MAIKKYRYFMNGMFYPTDGEFYEIDIPSPLLHNSREGAMSDGNFGYRFILPYGDIEPIIIVFERENIGDNLHPKVWVEGKIIGIYTFENFKNANGTIRMLKSELKESCVWDSNTDFLDTDKTFKDVFPNMQKSKLYYIDNEAYRIEEVDVDK